MSINSALNEHANNSYKYFGIFRCVKSNTEIIDKYLIDQFLSYKHLIEFHFRNELIATRFQMKKLLFFLVLNFSLLFCQSLRKNSTNTRILKRNQLNCDDMNMLKRKLSLFRINVRNWEIDLVTKGMSELTSATQKLFKFVDRNVTSDQSQCNVMSPQQMCAQKTVRRTFANHFPAAMIEKQCTCDKCHSMAHTNSFLNNQEFACQLEKMLVNASGQNI